MPTSYEYLAPDESGTLRLGRALASVLPDGAVVALNGTLGAGKTRLVQALAEAEGVPTEEVTSPTFMLVNEYQGRRPIFHFDAYRLRNDEEFLDLGPEEYFARGGLALIEWAQRVERWLPRERLEILIEPTGETARRFVISGHGKRMQQAVDELARLL
jgi:tRNA threonylcarbamoyladenosine biosynthesis protein TsaE